MAKAALLGQAWGGVPPRRSVYVPQDPDLVHERRLSMDVLAVAQPVPLSFPRSMHEPSRRRLPQRPAPGGKKPVLTPLGAFRGNPALPGYYANHLCADEPKRFRTCLCWRSGDPQRLTYDPRSPATLARPFGPQSHSARNISAACGNSSFAGPTPLVTPVSTRKA